MKTRRLGNTDLELPIISFGASSLGHAFHYVRPEAGLEAVQVALELGIHHFDTSPFYGRGVSEVLLGIALRDVPRDQYTISTKLGRFGDDHFDFRPERVIESVDTSLFRLGTDCLDIVFLHDVEFTDYQRSIDQALPALLKEKQKGKVRNVGIAGYPFKPLVYALQNHKFDVTLNYNHYTLQNRRLATEMAGVLKQHGVGIINAAPFAQRLLTSEDLPDWHPADAITREACREAILYCRSRDMNPAKLCVQFSTRCEDLTTCVIGTGKPENVRNWVKWLDDPYEEEAIREVEKILAPVLDRNAIFGLPENNDSTSGPLDFSA
ncbi:D-threo-aldose 1-dehydrogenase [Novipirellula aureliae]|uniref:D-threo-aldose 1-dehydrogenase n=1 Tax=Novipirellula aureliae TaxID=2527966 RepID=A0A5C6DT72_9BACT|nr:aldo/keto reductase [Novipirellula aureliae]TWU39127.1 D-threo-aldose 1-dehydrogenase [Novipirellula aureliae]